MGRAWSGLMVAAVLSAFAVGCQNKLYDENKKLYDENKQLREQNDNLRTQQSPVLHQQPEQPVTANPQPPQPPPQTQAVVPNNPPPNEGPQPTENVGGLETKVNRAEGTTTVYLPSGVFFDPGQNTIKSDAKASLDKVVAALKGRFAGKKVRVEGHTDSTPIRVSKWASNQALSEARAKAVKEYLVAHGIEASRVTTKGFGDTKPRGSDMAKNRRVEVVVMTGG